MDQNYELIYISLSITVLVGCFVYWRAIGKLCQQARSSEIQQSTKVDKIEDARESADLAGKTGSFVAKFFRDLLPNKNVISLEQLSALKEALLVADFGLTATKLILERVENAAKKNQGSLSIEDLTFLVRSQISSITESNQVSALSDFAGEGQLRVFILVGVNGAGKTTTAAKLAAKFQLSGSKVVLVAADTFRAAAADQLEAWAKKIGSIFISKGMGADPAAVAYEGASRGKSESADVVIIDTAGRLHNKKELMDELSKIARSVKKAVPDALVQTYIVVDGTTGQNALAQIESFSAVAPLDGIIVTKLDGTAKGGVVVAAAAQYKLPIKYVGLGEKVEDLKIFNSKEFAESVFNL